MRTNGRRISRKTQRRDFCARNGRNETTTSPSMMHLSAARLRCVNGEGAVARGAHSMFCDGGGGAYGDGDTDADADDNDDIDKNHVFHRDYNNDKKKKGVGKVGGEEEKEDDEEKKSKKDEEKAKVEMKKTKMEEEKKAKTE